MVGGAIHPESGCIDCGAPRKGKRWRCPECYSKERVQHTIANKIRTRNEALAAYGGKCACCGETNSSFLVIDHIDGGGRQHRLVIGGAGDKTYRWLRRNEYPPGFQVLCANCNMAKERPGGCPHQAAEGVKQ